MSQSFNSNTNETQVDYLKKYKLQKPYESLNEDEKKDIFHKLDNFLEVIYLTPQVFPKEILSALKFREEKLSFCRHLGQFIGFGLFSSIWLFYKTRYYPSFYFRNWVYYFLLMGITSYSFGRFFEFQANVRTYREMIFKMAIDYNISDEEITEIHQKMQEHYLKENQEKTNYNDIKFKL